MQRPSIEREPVPMVLMMANRPNSRCVAIDPDGRHLVGDPIDVVSGTHRDLALEFSLPGDVPLLWQRYYDSARHRTASALGFGHDHSFNHVLIQDLDGLRYEGPSGSTVSFPDLSDVGRGAAVDGWRLIRTGIARFLLRRHGRTNLVFQFPAGESRAPLSALVKGNKSAICRHGPEGRLESVSESGRSLSLEYDAGGHLRRILSSDPYHSRAFPILEYDYDDRGRLVAGVDGYRQSFSFGYNADGRMIRRTDRRGYSFEWDFDLDGRCIHSRGEDGVHEVWLRYDPQGMRTTVRRGDGGEWVYLYDESGVVHTVIDPFGAASQFILGRDGRITEELDGTGAATKWIYDPSGALMGRLSPRGDFEPLAPTPRSYSLHRVRQSSRPVGWAWGRLARQLERATEGPSLDRVSSLPRELAESLFLDQAPRVPLNLRFDQGGRLAGVRKGDAWVRRFSYDPNGSVRRILDAEGNSFLYGYDSWDFWARATDPTGRWLEMGWTSTEKLATCADAGGSLTQYDYDLKDRMTGVRLQGQIHREYRYDPGDRIIAACDGQGDTLWTAERNEVGRVVRLELASGGAISFEYNPDGNVKQAQCIHGTAAIDWHSSGARAEDRFNGLGIVHDYDRAGARVATTFLERFLVEYEQRGPLCRILRDPTGNEHRIDLLARDVLLCKFASGASQVERFREDGRREMQAIWKMGRRGVVLRRYEYSSEGDLLGEQELPAMSVGYRYDEGHRLVERKLPGLEPEEFSYDAAGNLVAQPGLDRVSIGLGNRLVSASGGDFRYDPLGRMAKRDHPEGSWVYRYDSRDMLIGIEGPDLAWEAGYDPFRRRVFKKVNGRTTHFRWDGDRLAAELRPDGSVRVYVYPDPGSLTPLLFVEYAGLDERAKNGRVYSVHLDHRSVPTLLLDDEGREAWRASVEPYGRVRAEHLDGVSMPLVFPGHYHDSETGLYCSRFRYYSPDLGRYIQPDPIGLGGGPNLYAYPANPLKRVDVKGLCEKTQPDIPVFDDDEPTLVDIVPPWLAEPEPHLVVDPRVLVDDVVNSRAIRIEGDATFEAGVRQDLELMAGTPSGAANLERIMDNHDQHGVAVTVAPMRADDHPEYGGVGPHVASSGTDPRVGPRGESGTPTSSTVRYTPGDDRPAPGSNGGSPSDAVLFHEMTHAENNGAGEQMSGHPPGNPRNGNAEEQNTVQAENQYRTERGGAENGYPLRDGWDHLP